MKKVLILAFACLISFATFAQREPSNQEIAQTILRSKEANKANGIYDPNLIHPGDVLTFMFADGTTQSYEVGSMNTQWQIVRDVIRLGQDHGGIVDYPTPNEAKPGTLTPIRFEDPITNEESNSSWPLYVFLGIAVLALIIYLVNRNAREKQAANREREQRARVTPETAGPPVVHGGITRENVEQVMIEAARRIHPNQAIIIDQLEQGTVDSHGHQVLVNYGDTPRMQVLENRPAVRATYRIQGRDDVYTGISLLGCANDIRMSNPMLPNLDHLTFTPTVANQRPGLTRDLAQERRQADSDSLKVTSTDFEVGMENLPSVIKTIADGNTNGDIKLDFGSVKVSVSVQQVAKPVEAA